MTGGICFAASLLVTIAGWQASAASFTPLGFLGDTNRFSRANAVSADGISVVGVSSGSSEGESEAFLWSRTTGLIGLGDLEGDSFASEALAVSHDGAVASGVGASTNSAFEAFVWHGSAGMRGLASGGSPIFPTGGRGLSGDGSTVVGSSKRAGGFEAFLWSESSGLIGLGDLPGGSFFSIANAVSSDGSIVVGRANSASGTEGFVWTRLGGMQGLGDLPGGGFLSEALAISADGSVIGGHSRGSLGVRPVRWTAEGGPEDLGTLGGVGGAAQAVSADGSVIAGWAGSSEVQGGEAFLWDASNGMRSVRVLLASQGIDLTGWRLSEITGISSDGSVLVGFGTNPGGTTEAFVVVIPEPQTLVLVGLGSAILSRIRRRRD